MSEQHYTRYCAIEKALENDGELGLLKRRLEAVTCELQTVLSRLSEEDRATVTEYLGIQAEIDQRIVELACFIP